MKAPNGWDEPRLTRATHLPITLPVGQPGDMACPKEVLNHKSPREPECRGKAERTGILMDEHVRPRQLSLLLCSPARVATWRAVEIPWAPVTCTRVETWTSYRGADCENKQGRSLDIIQGGRLRELTGQKLGHHTGGKAVRTIRVQTGTFHRGQTCEEYQIPSQS